MKHAVLLLALAMGCRPQSRPPSLGESIAVEQPGGSVSQLFSQGSEIPTSATESFTTGKDGERRIVIHVLRGTGRTAAKLHSDSWWSVEGVGGESEKAGLPQVLVTFELDDRGQLSLSAREDDRRLAVKRVEKGMDKLSPSPLTEPDEDEDAEADPEE